MAVAEKGEKPRRGGQARFLRAGDLVVIACVLLLAGVSFFFLYVQAEPGSTAVVTTPDGTLTLPLDTDTRQVLTGKNGIEVSIVVSDGRVRFEESGCPDQICVHTGWLSGNGQSAACLPAGIVVRVEGGDDDLDYVVY